MIDVESTITNLLTKPHLQPIIIWNLRLSCPDDTISTWDYDVSDIFRWLKYHPDIAAAFFILLGILHIPSGQIFRDNINANNFEHILHGS